MFTGAIRAGAGHYTQLFGTFSILPTPLVTLLALNAFSFLRGTLAYSSLLDPKKDSDWQIINQEYRTERASTYLKYDNDFDRHWAQHNLDKQYQQQSFDHFMAKFDREEKS